LLRELEGKMNSYIFETIEHDKEFPAKVFVASIDTSSFHWHYDYELMVVLKGSIIMRAGLEPYTLNVGDVVMFNSKKVHSLKKTDQSNLCLFIQLPPHLFKNSSDENQTFSFYLNSASRTMLPKIAFSVFAQTAAEIGLRSSSKELADRFRIKALIYKLVADLFEYTQYDIRQYPNIVNNENNSEMLLQIIEFIGQHMESKNITMELCKHICMSEKTLYRFLKNSTGLTVKDILDSSRIEKSKEMLRQTSKSISFIAQECGFHNEVTFYRTFKKETGVTPNDYREKEIDMLTNLVVQGYLNYDIMEAYVLLRQYL
jgi:AraC-like DNA-binding protein/quercetin dioxygenase-like cupin family protein